MGYRSEVALILNESGNSTLTKFLKGTEEEKVLADAERMTRDGFVMYRWRFIKWYPDVVEKIMDCLEFMDKEQYYFIRVGEEFSDVEDAGELFECPFHAWPLTTLETSDEGAEWRAE